MAFPRAALYQTNITSFFATREPRAFVAQGAPDDRILAPGSGTRNAPIDVDRFIESRPIEVVDSDDEPAPEPAGGSNAARREALLFDCCICHDTFVNPVVHVVKFPVDSRATATYTYSVVVTSQRTSGGLVFPVNACVTDLLPVDSQPWRGNVLVFKHSSRVGWPIIGVTESSKELVNTIVSYVISEGLIGVEDLGGQAE
ncbi:hypothetical protein B0H15DRAFT_955343 [Mycena belliarum]|uniref:Uncharacterized protein n=1 Tax=Mycena belliarum TaxID=1033014 RepID=A0AAD6XG33_9AGAR|nr:hypothetical protein B0H15DRAFT_955590 [Mycena belliae]KAJ7077024.1 hypothetical protein B0H15DRAFT_955343 [Mycena belliae]